MESVPEYCGADFTGRRCGHIYVCGDANRMAKDVEQALLEVIAEFGGLDTEAADEFLSELRVERRYQRDVYSAASPGWSGVRISSAASWTCWLKNRAMWRNFSEYS